jgi:sodium-dependent dicarboxylate transporter 2/3/5
MRTFHQALDAVEVYSPAEEQFNRRRRTAGLVLGPVTLVTMLVAPLPLAMAPHRMAAILAMVVVLWITEAIPITVTAILGPVLAVVFGVSPAREALAPFADPIIFLFIGSFILAEAMFVHGLDRRIAFTALSWRAVGSSAGRILIVYGVVGTAISMWISNTATTAMLFPIGLSILAHLQRTTGSIRRFAIAMMLITSFGPSVGGMATPVGTPPNGDRAACRGARLCRARGAVLFHVRARSRGRHRQHQAGAR